MADKANNSEEVRDAIFDIWDEEDEENEIFQETKLEATVEPQFKTVEIDGDKYDFEITEDSNKQETDETDYDENAEYFYSDEQQLLEDEIDNLIEKEYQAVEKEAHEETT